MSVYKIMVDVHTSAPTQKTATSAHVERDTKSIVTSTTVSTLTSVEKEHIIVNKCVRTQLELTLVIVIADFVSSRT